MLGVETTVTNLFDDQAIIRRAFSGHRLPIILQAEAAECGLACIAMVAGYHGYATSLAELRRRFSTSLNGSTLKALMEMSDSIGFTCRPIRLDLDEIEQLKTPSMLHWDLSHFVVLRRANRRGLWIHDPALGERHLSLEDASRHITGVALELTPTPQFQKKDDPQRVRAIRPLRTSARPHSVHNAACGPGVGPPIVRSLISHSQSNNRR